MIISKIIKMKKKSFFMLTSRLNQAPLENLFSIIRQKNGYSKNPTCRTFRACFASAGTFSLMKCTELTNYEPDDDTFLTVNTLSNVSMLDSTHQFNEAQTNFDQADINMKSDSSSISISYRI